MTDSSETIISYKILILGDTEVGKTSFILRFCDNTFPEESITTIGIDTKTKFIKFEEKKIQLVIWLTAGQERFRSIPKNTIKGADGILIMYAVDNKKSFDAIKKWINNIKDCLNIDKIGLIVTGNKCDVPESEVQVDKEMAKDLEEKEKVSVMEVSAKNDINVNEAFIKLIEQMIKLGIGKKRKKMGGIDDDEDGNDKGKNITIEDNKGKRNNLNNCCKK